MKEPTANREVLTKPILCVGVNSSQGVLLCLTRAVEIELEFEGDKR